ncbi:MAG TPA: hypothetical protein PKM36_12145 [Propionibacteriaceae bacterium]|nr:hypothetical protein [Propionibacteriaceae bacterium]HPZ50014.1 hypothetical protein [Propionibacteriaceae bacterium]HQE32009.1 hypothetical protein [Propionibacteriaceae bacterium]
MLPIDITLTPTERFGPVVAILLLGVLAGLVAWVVLRALRRR